MSKKSPANQTFAKTEIADEELAKVQFRIQKFYVTSYQLFLQPEEFGVPNEELNFKTKNQIHFAFKEEKVYIDVAVNIFGDKKKPEKVISSIETRSEFDLKNLPQIKIDSEHTQVKIPELALSALLSIAISNTRGLLSMVSNGVYILPPIPQKNIQIESMGGTDLINSISSSSTELSPLSSQS
jgi:hypothetical protein